MFIIQAMLAVCCCTSCDYIAYVAIDEPSSGNTDNRVIGNWKVEEDTNKNNFYEVRQAHADYPNEYHVRFWNRGGTNPTYEANMYFSKIGNVQFLNIPHWEGHFSNMGFFFLKVLDINADATRITATMITDTTLQYCRSSRQLQELILKNTNNPRFYDDTFHFYKVK